MRLLLAEDDPMVGASMETGLRLAGYAVDWVTDGHAALFAAESGVHDLLLLDLGLPGQEGFSVLKRLRQQENAIPVLIVTARDAVSDRVNGLNLGGDDYIVKPFDLDELIARVRALIRRRSGRGSSEIRLGSLLLDTSTRTLFVDGTSVELSQREFGILEYLLQRPGSVVSRAELEDRLWGWNEEIASNAVEVHLHKLRRKLGAEWIRNVRGVGYKIVVPE